MKGSSTLRWKGVGLVAVLALMLPAVVPAVTPVPGKGPEADPETRTLFEGWGTFVAGVECILFQADEGSLFLTDAVCPVGETAYIVGEIWECASICMQEDACLEVHELSGCSVGADSRSWDALKACYR